MADYLKIRAAFDNAMVAFNVANPVTVGPYVNEAMDIAMENERYDPTAARPWQEIYLLPATSQQPGLGADGVSFDTGIYQITLNFPRDEGPGAAAGRADLLRSYFRRSLILTFSGVSVMVERTPSISPATISDSWYKLVVSVPYFIYS